MAYLDWYTSASDANFARTTPVPMATVLELSNPAFPVVIGFGELAALACYDTPTNFQPAVVSFGNVYYQSTAYGAGDVVPHMDVTLDNCELSRQGYNELYPLFEQSSIQSQNQSGRRTWPRISDLFSAGIHPIGTKAHVYVAAVDVDGVRFDLFYGVVESISYGPRTITLHLVTDRRWDDTIPRHYSEDRLNSGTPRSGTPIPTHYGRWGGTGLASGAAGASGVMFYPYGDTTPTGGFYGGYCSPLPAELKTSTLLDASAGRVYYAGRGFDAAWPSYLTFGSNGASVYTAVDGGIARLHGFFAADGGVGSASSGGSDSDVWPQYPATFSLHKYQRADFKLLPDRVDDANSDWESTDSLGNISDGLQKTWSTETIAVGATKTLRVFFNGGANKGTVRALAMAMSAHVNTVPYGNAYTVAATLTFGFAQSGESTMTPENMTQFNSEYINRFSIAHAITSAALDETENGIQSWDFHYNYGSAGNERQPCYLELTLEHTSGSLPVEVHLHELCLLVDYNPSWLDSDVRNSLPVQGTQRIIALTGDPAQFATTLSNQYETRGQTGASPTIFIDSPRGCPDYYSYTIAPYNHYYSYSGPIDEIENPSRIAAHLIDSFGTGRRDSGGDVETEAAPYCKWGTSPTYGRLGDFDLAAEKLDWYVSTFTGGEDTQYRCHWIVDGSDSILDSAQRLANEHPLYIENFATRWDSAGLTPPPGLAVSDLDIYGAWVPTPLPYTADVPIGFVVNPEPETLWRGGEYLNHGDIIDFEFEMTPLADMVNAVTVRYAYDYTRNRYLRTTYLDKDEHTGHDEQTDLADIMAPFDQLLCADSFARYGQRFHREVKLRSVYRYTEAMVIRSLLIRRYFRQRLMARITVSAQAMDLAVPGKCFYMTGTLSDGEVGAALSHWQMLNPRAIQTLGDFAGGSAGYHPSADVEGWWRVVRFEHSPSHPPTTTIWAIRGI